MELSRSSGGIKGGGIGMFKRHTCVLAVIVDPVQLPDITLDISASSDR
jgi:hypothetical protein